MKIKRLGEAKIDLEDELWTIDGIDERFRNNPRLIDLRPDIKALRSTFRKVIRMDTPSRQKPLKREAYFQARDEYEHEKKEVLNQAYQDILAESETTPILLQKEKNFIHPREWRHVMYQGVIYELDRHGASEEDILQAIQALLARINPPAPETAASSEPVS